MRGSSSHARAIGFHAKEQGQGLAPGAFLRFHAVAGWRARARGSIAWRRRPSRDTAQPASRTRPNTSEIANDRRVSPASTRVVFRTRTPCKCYVPRRTTGPSDRGMVRKGSPVRVRQRALGSACKRGSSAAAETLDARRSGTLALVASQSRPNQPTEVAQRGILEHKSPLFGHQRQHLEAVGGFSHGRQSRSRERRASPCMAASVATQ
jgi:hypothetical protein